MKSLKDFIEELRKLADEAPSTAMKIPPNENGLPVGVFSPHTLLHYMADNLDGQRTY